MYGKFHEVYARGLRYASGQTDRQTYTLIAILRVHKIQDVSAVLLTVKYGYGRPM